MKALNTYNFTLILDGVDDETPELEDELYRLKCDDGLINFRNGTVYLDFDRDAKSLEQAVLSAIKSIESSKLNMTVLSVAPDDFVSESEIAKRLGLKRQAVSLWVKGARRNQASFPKPVMKLSERSPLWRWLDVATWLFNQGQIDDQEILNQAEFIEHINAALHERDRGVRLYRQRLLKKLKLAA